MTKKNHSRMKPQAYLVESIPLGMDDLKEPQGAAHTGAVLRKLVEGARESISLTAMYWALRPNPKRSDEQGFSRQTLLEEFGAKQGQDLFDALVQAARRGVHLRILQPLKSFDPADDESKSLQELAPDQVEISKVDLPAWFGGGIMHQKIWIFDQKHIYLGSANMDWKSLTQVKEMGIVVKNNPQIAGELGRYFDAWWAFSDLKKPTIRHDVPDPNALILRTLPAWSELVPADQRIDNPLDIPELRSPYSWEDPMSVKLDGQTAGVLFSGAPRELCLGNRPFDEEVLVKTILAAETSVCISVMDFAPVSLYRGDYDENEHKNMIGDKVATPVWWPALFDALLHVVSTKAVHARLLVSEWAHTSKFIGPYLRVLSATAQAGFANDSFRVGRLEIRRFRVPGWDKTEVSSRGYPSPGQTEQRAYPGHTRVNHTKYIVTDNRVNIGTSNMTWDYFAGTAGSSFNSDHPGLVSKLQVIFDRDWNSPYAAANT